MALPKWTDQKLGGKARAALWLETVVGEGNIFTKADLRAAFPDLAQIDRRMRDLRNYGWEIATSRDDVTLLQEEQRYVKKGAEVWIPGQAKSKGTLTSAQRSEIMHGDNNLCRSCGIAAGDSYADGRRAQLDIARREVRLPDRSVETQHVTECSRCRIGGNGREADASALLDKVNGLTRLERQVLAGWISADRRVPGPLEEIWGQFRALPKESREIIAQNIDEERN